MIDLFKLQSCIEEIEEALTLPASGEQIERLMSALEEGDKILKGERDDVLDPPEE
jgi:hypothetical protein